MIPFGPAADAAATNTANGMNEAQRHYAAFVGAEAELARLRADIAALADRVEAEFMACRIDLPYYLELRDLLSKREES